MNAILITIVISITIQVHDYPYSDEPVYLQYVDRRSGVQVALATEIDGELVPFTGWVVFPGNFNSFKTSASFEEETRTLYVYSQYPYSADYALATYRLGEDGMLSLLEAGDHDFYFEALQCIQQSIDDHDLYEAFDDAWSVVYPDNNPYKREMCILLLKGGLHYADSLISVGVPPDSALECFDEIDDISRNLTFDDVYLAVTDFSFLELTISQEEYLQMLDHYADLLESAGNPERAEEVRAVIEEF